MKFLDFRVHYLRRRTPLSLRCARGQAFRSDALEVTLSGFAGGETLPLPRSEGGAFPFRSAELTTKPAPPLYRGPRTLVSFTDNGVCQNSANSTQKEVDYLWAYDICYHAKCLFPEWFDQR